MKTISMHEFVPMLDELAEIWPSITASSRSKRYFAAIADLEKDVVQIICTSFLDKSSKMPLPSDFHEAARLYRSHYFERTGRYYGSNKGPLPTTPHKPECDYCYDSGFEWIEIEQNSVFCFCFCKAGDLQQRDSSWMFPKAIDLVGVRKKIFPWKAFVPKNKEESKIEGEFLDTVKRFKNALSESRDFWKFYFQREKRAQK